MCQPRRLLLLGVWVASSTCLAACSGGGSGTGHDGPLGVTEAGSGEASGPTVETADGAASRGDAPGTGGVDGSSGGPVLDGASLEGGGTDAPEPELDVGEPEAPLPRDAAEDSSIVAPPDAGYDLGATGDATDTPIGFPCPAGWTLCGETCYNTASDPNHCGDCTTICGGGKVCVGTCKCPAGQTDCNGRCTDITSDPNNCLVCGEVCGGGKVCAAAEGCQCPEGLTECVGICVDTTKSTLDCGTCGYACASYQVCSASKCTCPPDQLDCGTEQCIDIKSDADHCGGCDKPCDTGEICSGGFCVCAPDRTECPSGICADTSSDPANCGGCGTTCDPGKVCNEGHCSDECTVGLANCGGACVDLQTSDAHCGDCAIACDDTEACSSGHCVCAGGRIDCGGVCINPLTDKANCATCGHACPGTSFCEEGECRCVPGYDLCGATCVDTQWNAEHCGDCATACTGGQMCSQGKCLCPPPQVDCDGTCANTLTDVMNCGACGHACEGGSCISGNCTCPPYYSSCEGQCIPTANDPLNCGACGHACQAGQVCISNACTSSCYGGLTACNGTCVDTASDRNNCGSCGHVCDAGTGCAGGNCVPSVVLGPAPAKCVDGGPPILLTTDGSSQICSGNIAATTFPWAICTCDSFTGKGSQTFDAYNSTEAPYLAGGLGAGVGVNGTYDGGSSMSCTGTLWSYQSIDPGNATIRQELHVGGLLDGNVGVTGTGYVVTPHDRGTFAGDLYTQSCPATGYTVLGTCHADPGLTVPAPCQRCEGSNQVPVQGYVDYFAVAAHNDNAAIGLSPSTFNSGGAATVLDLPCGYYYLDRIVADNSVTIAAHGNTALFIGGSVDVKGALVLALDANSRFDVFVAGTIYADGTLTMGSAAYPANLRIYVGGTCQATGATCVQKGDCCSATCTDGVCSDDSLLPDDPPWGMYMKAATNIAADIYAPNGEIYAGASFSMYGAIFTGDYRSSASTTIHYDRAALDQGKACPPPPGGCSSCLDCGNQACVDGVCGECTNDGQCCPPLVCIGGRCDLSES